MAQTYKDITHILSKGREMTDEEEVEESFDAFEAFRKAHPEEAESLQSVVSLAREAKQNESISAKSRVQPTDKNRVTMEL